jgi:hypothetical protein
MEQNSPNASSLSKISPRRLRMVLAIAGFLSARPHLRVMSADSAGT